MRICIPIRALSAASAFALLCGCSGGSAIAPRPSTQQTHSWLIRIPAGLSPIGMLKVNMNTGRHFTTFDSCPATGAIEYISDYNNSVINIYNGKFAGQGPCGQLVDALLNPENLFVKGSTHDLYVANSGSGDILVFHRGATTHYMTYTDPTGVVPEDVTVARDGTVIASNIYSPFANENGSISTWHSDGTFVGNFPMVNDLLGESVTVQKNGTVYFNDVDKTSGAGLLWTGKCPAGACGTFTSTGATSSFPGGLRSADNEDVVQVDQNANTVSTYESFPTAMLTCTLLGAIDADGDDIDKSQHHLFFADALNNVAGEVRYPTCAPVGGVPFNTGGLPAGAAVDAPESL